MIREPLVHALAMEAVVASWKNLQLLAVGEHAEADAALRLLRRREVAPRVEDDREPLDRLGVEAAVLRRRQRRVARRDGVGEEEPVVVAADPAREDEERGEEEDDGEEDDDEEELAAADFEGFVVEFSVVVPIQ